MAESRVGSIVDYIESALGCTRMPIRVTQQVLLLALHWVYVGCANVSPLGSTEEPVARPIVDTGVQA
eukprot:1309788-Lingulodinium_polyedra.AAC.1